jgi:hypothetical protein
MPRETLRGRANGRPALARTPLRGRRIQQAVGTVLEIGGVRSKGTPVLFTTTSIISVFISPVGPTTNGVPPHSVLGARNLSKAASSSRKHSRRLICLDFNDPISVFVRRSYLTRALDLFTAISANQQAGCRSTPGSNTSGCGFSDSEFGGGGQIGSGSGGGSFGSRYCIIDLLLRKSIRVIASAMASNEILGSARPWRRILGTTRRQSGECGHRTCTQCLGRFPSDRVRSRSCAPDLPSLRWCSREYTLNFSLSGPAWKEEERPALTDAAGL